MRRVVGSLKVVRSEELLNSRHDRRQLFSYRLPNNIEVHVEIAVNKTIAHGDDVGPGNLRRLRPKFTGNLTGCFAKNLDRLHKGQRQRAVCFKFTFGLISDEGELFVRCINHVLQANDVRLEHTALRRRLGPLCGNIGSGPERYGDPPYGYPATWRVLARFERLPENLLY